MTLVSLFPKVVLMATAEGNYRGSCAGCGTVAVVGKDCATTFRCQHQACADQVERL